VRDVVIVGAGVIGCACAFELARAGARVSVFDVRQVGQGASQASAGVLAPYIEGHEASPLRELGRRSLDLYDDFMARLSATDAPAVHYSRGGTLEIAFEAEHAGNLQRSIAGLAADGVRARWIERDELRQVEPLASSQAVGGLLIDVHGFLSVPQLTDALAAAAMLAGATFGLESRVIAIEPAAGGGVDVHTENGVSHTESVVLAAGSWSPQVRIAGSSPVPDIKPVRGQLLHLAWPTSQPLRHVLWGTDCYIVPWQNGRVLVGATVEDVGFDERATAAGVRDLLEAGCSLVPQLWQASFEQVRVGLRPASPDALPVVGRSQIVPGLVYATGHYRNGVLLAPLTAALVKEIVFEQAKDPALEILAPGRLGRY
jgi:glycine oxidase